MVRFLVPVLVFPEANLDLKMAEQMDTHEGTATVREALQFSAICINATKLQNHKRTLMWRKSSNSSNSNLSLTLPY